MTDPKYGSLRMHAQRSEPRMLRLFAVMMVIRLTAYCCVENGNAMHLQSIPNLSFAFALGV